MKERLILDLCGGTGGWSRPYREAGYNVITVDPLAKRREDYKGSVQDFYRDCKAGLMDMSSCHGVLFGPPCTEFAGSGARWWASKHPQLVLDAVEVVRAGLDIIKMVNPKWWAMENPVGRLRRMVPEAGQWCMTFQPNDYGDPYTKRTCLWGHFNIDLKQMWVEPKLGSLMASYGPSPDRWKKRSITPPGFANAFFMANR